MRHFTSPYTGRTSSTANIIPMGPVTVNTPWHVCCLTLSVRFNMKGPVQSTRQGKTVEVENTNVLN